jgi:Na+:H+ antiporter
MDIETAFILLFVVATAVAIAARRLRLPYTVALVLTGLILGALDLFPAPHLTKNLLFSVFLPGLIFEAAFHIQWREFRDNLLTLLTLAVPGVIASTALVAFVLPPVIGATGVTPGFGWPHALVFGALISATDPVAVVALFRNLGAPRRLTTLLDGESLLNDGTAIVFFALSLSLVEGTATTAGSLTMQFASIVGVGAGVGALIGAMASLLMRQIDDPMIEITLTTIAAYGSFVTAETLHASGVIATVGAGMLCGNLGARTGMSASTRLASESFWEYITFALNSIVFLLIGFEVHLPTLLSYWLPILVAFLVVTVGRALVITAGRALLGLTRERFPWRWTVVLTWGGLRGALPMVLVLSLPTEFAYHELLVSMTFGVAVISILVQGVTMSGLLSRLGIVSEPANRTAYEIRAGRLRAAAAALRELEHLSQTRAAAPEILDTLRAEYAQMVEGAEKQLRSLTMSAQQLQDQELCRIRRHLLDTERDQVIQAFRQGELGPKSQETLLADLDTRLVSLETGPSKAGISSTPSTSQTSGQRADDPAA